MFKLVLEKAEEPEMEKAREFQKSIYFCFIDYAKAFDCVDHNKLWKKKKNIYICMLTLRYFSHVRLFCDCMDCSPPGSSVHGILPVRILEWVAMVSFRGFPPPPGIEPTSLMSHALAGKFVGEGSSSPLQYSCLENPMDRGAW